MIPSSTYRVNEQRGNFPSGVFVSLSLGKVERVPVPGRWLFVATRIHRTRMCYVAQREKPGENKHTQLALMRTQSQHYRTAHISIHIQLYQQRKTRLYIPDQLPSGHAPTNLRTPRAPVQPHRRSPSLSRLRPRHRCCATIHHLERRPSWRAELSALSGRAKRTRTQISGL